MSWEVGLWLSGVGEAELNTKLLPFQVWENKPVKLGGFKVLCTLKDPGLNNRPDSAL